MFTHHSAPRRQTTARAGGWDRGELHGQGPEHPTPQAAGTQYFYTAVDDEEVPAAERPPPLREARPQEGTRRHMGMAFELVLDNVVPQLGRGPVDVPGSVLIDRLTQAVLEIQREREQEGGGSRSSNKMGGRRKRKKRRKKKLPESSSSYLLSRAVGWMEHEHEGAATTEYVQHADVHFHAVVFNTLHAGPMISVHSKEVTGCTGPGGAARGMKEVHKYFEEKVIRDTGEEIILKNGKPAFNLYGDRTHLYPQSLVRCWLNWEKILIATYGGRCLTRRRRI